MNKIISDEQAIKIINQLTKFDFENEDKSSEMLISLEDYITGLADVITQERKPLTPEEMIILARERNKPIYL